MHIDLLPTAYIYQLSAPRTLMHAYARTTMPPCILVAANCWTASHRTTLCPVDRIETIYLQSIRRKIVRSGAEREAGSESFQAASPVPNLA